VAGGGDPARARTVAMLKRRTSQKPMVLRSWDLGSIEGTGRRVQGTGTAFSVQRTGPGLEWLGVECRITLREGVNERVFSRNGLGGVLSGEEPRELNCTSNG